MSEKHFNSPIENALCGCQFGVKLGKNRGYPYWILTSNERFLLFQVPDGCAKFRRNRFNIATVRARTDRQTDRQTDTHRDHTGAGLPLVDVSAYITPKKSSNTPKIQTPDVRIRRNFEDRRQRTSKNNVLASPLSCRTQYII